MEALSERGLVLGWHQLDLGIESPHLGQSLIPVGVEALRAGIDPHIRLELLQWKIKHQWHAPSSSAKIIQLTVKPL